MRARIEAAHAVRGDREQQSSRELATAAALGCLERAGCPPDRVDLITYSGILRDDHVQEPASAPFLQQAIGANPAPGEGYPRGTFSFDLSEFLSALEVAAGFVVSGRAQRALVVTADGRVADEPSSGIAPAAGALLLAPDPERGFGSFRSRNYPQWSDRLRRRAFWDGNRHVLRTETRDDWLERCVEATLELAREFFSEHGPPSESVLVIPSQSPRGFPAAIEKQLALPCVTAAVRGPEDLYSAGPITAMVEAPERFRQADQILFATVAPGLISTLAFYDKRPDSAF